MSQEFTKLQHLSKRLLRPNHTDNPHLELIPGDLPKDLAFPLPFPDESVVIGSIVRQQGHSEIVIDIPSTIQATADFYRKHFDESGWSEFKMPFGPTSGFSHRSEAYEKIIFCRSTMGPSVTLALYKIDVELTDTRLEIHPEGKDSPCAMSQKMQHYASMGMNSPIPSLRTPEGAEMVGGGGGGMDGQNWHTNITIRSTLNHDVLAAEYNQQLADAGWEVLSKDDGQAGSWSTWKVPDPQNTEWHGRLLIIPSLNTDGLHFGYLHAEQVE